MDPEENWKKNQAESETVSKKNPAELFYPTGESKG